MKAVRVTGYGGLDKLEVAKVPIPVPKTGEVVIKVHACGINKSDINMREGAYGTDIDKEQLAGWRREGVTFPRIPGSDIVGEIMDIGADVGKDYLNQKVILFPFQSQFKNGEEDITYIGSEYDGGYAEYVVWPAELCFPIPLKEYAESATFPVSALTSWHKINRTNLKEGETVLVTGATGGVGSFNVQIAAKVFGTKVIAVVGDLNQKDRLLHLGASNVVSYRSETLMEDILDVANGSVDAVLDVVGEPLFATSLAVLRREGRFNTSGGIAGSVAELDLRTLYLKYLTLIGSTPGAKSTIKEFQDLLQAISDGKVEPTLDCTFPLEEAKAAQSYFKESGKIGKVVLIP